MIEQTERVRIYLYHKLPTPYNDLLFRSLHNDERVTLKVYHLWRRRSNRPWTIELATGYSNRYLDAGLFGIDWQFLKLGLRERDSLFLIGDWAWPSSIVVLIARAILNFPVTIWADTPQEHLPRPWYKRIPRRLFLSWLLPKMDVVFGTGRPGTNALQKMGVPEGKIVNLPCFVSLDQPAKCERNHRLLDKSRRFRELAGCSEEGVIFLMSGMCTHKKGQDIGIKAFRQLLDQIENQDVGLLVAGDGPRKEELEALARHLGVSDKIVFLGWLDPEDMDAAYFACDVVVHPSRWDPFPLVILEGMSWGKVVIGSDVCGSVQDRIASGENGYAFPSEDVTALSNFMVQSATDSRLRHRIGTDARATAERWPVERGVDTIVRMAQRVLRSKE